LLWVGGEISNFTRAASGHWYFSLKDAAAQVRCVMFRHKSQHMDWSPKDGMQVEARALVTLYEARGDFQLNVETLRRAGLGALYEKFERLKAMLAAEGLFDDARKRPLPPFPRAIGVVTSTVGAALRDVLTTLGRRNPGTPVVIYPSPVQGEGAALKIAAAIGAASERGECDVLILCRGGGSIEDLWQFNEEIVARAIAACRVPLVSGVGHETDFTIADFVADRRAPTPTAAAEMVSTDAVELRRRLRIIAARVQRWMKNGIESRMQSMDHLARRLVHPGEHLHRQGEGVARLGRQLARSLRSQLQALQWQVASQKAGLSAARPDVVELMARLKTDGQRLALAMSRNLERTRSTLTGLGAELAHLNPEAVLERGYSIVSQEGGKIVHDADQLAIGASVSMRFARGRATGRVTGKDDV
jgi:exodeoxyribonuclease VII large subunit